jgi:hypothetical protein
VKDFGSLRLIAGCIQSRLDQFSHCRLFDQPAVPIASCREQSPPNPSQNWRFRESQEASQSPRGHHRRKFFKTV